MTGAEIIVHLRRVETLLREGRYDLALALTGTLEDVVAALPPDATNVNRAVRDLLQVSRLMTETLIRLRELRVH
jgi:hypothetical protein